MVAPSRSVHLSHPLLSQDILHANLRATIAAEPTGRLVETLARLFTAHVNDRLDQEFTWIPRYAAVIGPYGEPGGPSLEQMDQLIRTSFEDFLLLMPGSRSNPN